MSRRIRFWNTFALLAFTGILALLVSCSSAPEEKAVTKLQIEGDRHGFPMTVIDQLGRRIKLEKRPERIVSLAPAHTETLFAIGAGDQVVGVTEYCNYPPEAKRCQQIGGFAGHEISIERIVALEPDVVFTVGKYHRKLMKQLEQFDIPSIALEPASFEEIYKTIELAGYVTGHVLRAKEVVQSMKVRVKAVEAASAHSSRPTVLYVVQAQPLMTVGKRSFISEVIRRAGGKNVFDDIDADYPTVNPEAVVSRDPDIIVLPSHGTEYGDLDRLKQRAGWQSLSAVENHRMYTVDGDLMVRTSPRIVAGLERLAAKMFPERFSKTTLESARAAAEVGSE